MVQHGGSLLSLHLCTYRWGAYRAWSRLWYGKGHGQVMEAVGEGCTKASGEVCAEVGVFRSFWRVFEMAAGEFTERQVGHGMGRGIDEFGEGCVERCVGQDVEGCTDEGMGNRVEGRAGRSREKLVDQGVEEPKRSPFWAGPRDCKEEM